MKIVKKSFIKTRTHGRNETAPTKIISTYCELIGAVSCPAPQPLSFLQTRQPLFIASLSLSEEPPAGFF